MGVVYKAAMPLTGKIVALKVCSPAEIMLDLMGAQRVRELFLAEAVAMAGIRHPHVASVLDVGEVEVSDYREDRDSGEKSGRGRMVMPYFVMEYYCTDLGQVMGENYEVERPSRAVRPDHALEYVRQMLQGLRRLHFAGLVHRDVKPFNVMLTDEDQVKLIDFGLSRLRGETKSHASKGPRGMVVGSPYYTAPEQEADPDAADERADLFSVGVTLFRMVTGLLPEDEAGAARTASLLGQEQKWRADWRPDSVWDVFFARAMHPDPDLRYQSAAQMLEGLAELARHFERTRAEACAWVDDEQGRKETGKQGQSTPPPRGPLRGSPLKIRQKEGRRAFGLDELWRPLRQPRGGGASSLQAGGELVRDPVSGLLWQAGGSAYPLDYGEAQQYVESLRETRYQGQSGWRLPTVDELASILTEAAGPGGLCLPPLFDPAMQLLWSADTKAFTSAWYVNAGKGFVWWQDTTCRFYVRAVCSGSPS